MGKKEKIRADQLVYGIFGLLGVVFLLVAVILLGRYFHLQKNYEKITAVVTLTNQSPSYTDIEYTYEGEMYRATLSEYSTSYYPGKRIQVYVDREYPFECISILGTAIVLLVFAIVGIIFFAIGIIGFFGSQKFWKYMPRTNEAPDCVPKDAPGVNEYFGNDSLAKQEGNYGYWPENK